MPESAVNRLGHAIGSIVHKGRAVIAFILVMHGVAHLVGTRSAVQAVDADPLEYLFGVWEISDPIVLYTLAALWTVVSAGFAVAGWLTYMAAQEWRYVTRSAAGASLVLCVLALPVAWIGAVVNLAVLTLTLEAAPVGVNQAAYTA